MMLFFNKVEDQNNADSLDFGTSQLRYFSKVIKVLTGVGLSNDTSSTLCKWLFYIIGYCMISSNLLVNVAWWIDVVISWNAVATLNSSSDVSSNKSSTDLLRETVESVASTAYYFGVPLCFYLVSFTQSWTSLLNDMNNQFFIEANIKNRLKKLEIFSFIILISVLSTLL